jgi:hypothetical protein
MVIAPRTQHTDRHDTAHRFDMNRHSHRMPSWLVLITASLAAGASARATGEPAQLQPHPY